MGKIKNLLLLLTILINLEGIAQNYNIGYILSYKAKTGSATKSVEQYDLLLDTVNKNSLFKSMNPETSDFNHIVYKDFSKSIFRNLEMIYYRFYQIDYKFTPDWLLLSDKKKLNGYICRKAEINFGGRIWTAWYSTEIPIPDGPYKFSGLPGLILEIYSSDDDYCFTVNKIERTFNNQSEIEGIPFKSKENEDKFKENYINDPAAQYRQVVASNKLQVTASYNGKISDNKDIIKTIESNFRSWLERHDNPIEKDMIWIK